MNRRWFQLAILLVLVCVPAVAITQPVQGPIAKLRVEAASLALESGDWNEAERLASGALLDPASSRVEKTEAWRIRALAAFAQGEIQAARDAFLFYLRLDPEAHLDPTLVTPEAIALLEDIRARHRVELDALKPKPRTKRYLALNLLPGAGQWQNSEKTKAILILSAMAVLGATNLGSYLWLKRNCGDTSGLCKTGSVSDSEEGRRYLGINIVSGVGLVGVAVYSMVDGYLGYRQLEERDRQRAQWQVFASPQKASIGRVWTF